jgi:LysM repeat protein
LLEDDLNHRHNLFEQKKKKKLVTAVLFAAMFVIGAVSPLAGANGALSRHIVSAASSADPISSGNWQFDQYDWIIVQEAQSHGLDPFVVKGQILLESWFNPNAYSQWGDMGLMQIKFNTAEGLGYSGSWSGLFDPETNIHYGTMLLQQLVQQFGDLSLGLQAYNIGSYAVSQGVRNWAYSNGVLAYAQMFRDEHDRLCGCSSSSGNSGSSQSNTGGGTSGSGSSGSSSSSSTTTTNNGNSQPGATTYTVNSGDYLYKISEQYGVNWQFIAQKNGIQVPYFIYPGQQLQIPASTYTVQTGDYLYKIAQELGVSWQSIAQANGISSPYLIYPGEQLTIPAN